METKLIGYNYDRKRIKTGIVHIGVGNFTVPTNNTLQT